MDTSKVLFWGAELKPGAPKTFDLEDGEVLHVNMATLGEKLAAKNGRSVVSAKVNEEGDKHALCALTAGRTESFNLDLTFTGPEHVVLEVSGENVVSLVGNFAFEGEDSDDDDESMLINEYSDSDEDDDDSEEEPALVKEADPPVITELADDEPAKPMAITAGPGKKQKGKHAKPGKVPAKPAKQEPPAKQKGFEDEVEDDNGDEDEDEDDVEEEQPAQIVSERPTGGPGKRADAEKAAEKGADKGASKKRGLNADAGQTPSVKKPRTDTRDGPRGKRATPAKKDAKDLAQRDGTPAAPKPGQKKAGGHEEKGTPAKKGGSTPMAASTPSDGGGDDSAGKKKKRRRKSKGGSAGNGAGPAGSS